ncbi:hypothetical protein ACFL0S_07000, partial [Thermodesulfobacteriota bacterium]
SIGNSSCRHQGSIIVVQQQVYLAEKIFECLWWIRRYEQQQRATIARKMVELLKDGQFSILTSNDYKIVDTILDPVRRHELDELFKESSYTELSLMQEAFAKKKDELEIYNKQITVLAKNLSGFQASYEVLTSRKLHIERLRLQNKLLEKDLSAIEIEALPDASQSEKTGR